MSSKYVLKIVSVCLFVFAVSCFKVSAKLTDQFRLNLYKSPYLGLGLCKSRKVVLKNV